MNEYELELNKQIKLAEDLEKLMDNPIFKEIIQKVFLEDSVLALSSNLSRIPVEKRPLLVEQIVARNVLREFLVGILETGRIAKDDLARETLGEEDAE